ncbi:aldehyde-activating protein [Labrys miyagiensis]|uniref:Aldehyde-activating protein n=1 Tax=Labrys miyagiensis TaxID=346912 RepID=A0ABQ6CVB2_9HYPH|nr:GFA family protein [Labrys miyagiensis]GLS24238.1 aldehyde-activating protein [Labrys miyagiensis]
MGEVNKKPVRATGGCLCGSVRYTIRGVLHDVWACHCILCRRLHSHYCAYAACDSGDIEIAPSNKLRWYRSSPLARRGFCSKCGAQIFSVTTGRNHISIAASTINEPTGLKLVKHTNVSQKGDYYEITDGLPQERGKSLRDGNC